MVQNSEEYFQFKYEKDQRSGFQGFGNALIDKYIEKFSPDKANKRILEVGGSSGEHISFIKDEKMFTWAEYNIVDLQPGLTNLELFHELSEKGIIYTQANIENLAFENDSFDLVLSTCVFAHIDDPEKALSELRRVTINSGRIVIGLPCDPGMVNRFVKLFITYPQMRRNGNANPRLNYARDHQNSIGNLLVLLKHVFRGDSLQLRFRPFFMHSWNLNPFIIAVINIVKE